MTDRNVYSEFYEHHSQMKNGLGIVKPRIKLHLFAACRRFDRLVAFAVLLPLATKLQKRNQDIYQGYHMIDQLLSDLQDVKNNIEEEFSAWFKFAVDMGAYFGIHPDKPRIAKCWSNFENNVPNTDNESYYRRSCDGKSNQQLRA